MHVLISQAADADLDAILDYSIATHGRDRAEAYLRMIHTTFGRLLDYPSLGMARPDIKTGIRTLPAGEHLVHYRLDGDIVLIVRVLHKAMDPARHF
jgi:toxin ParE1/3/4